jgi:hypothetical protein
MPASPDPAWNERRDLFFTASDRQAYLGLLRKYAELYCVEIQGYCVMTNHVHLVAIPAAAEVEIRRATFTVRPLGGPAFVQDLELYLKRLGSGASRQAEEGGGNRCRKVRNARLSPDFISQVDFTVVGVR